MTCERTALLPGILHEADGRVEARPVVVTMVDGAVKSWHPLDGHEPHSTVMERALLALPSQRMVLPDSRG